MSSFATEQAKQRFLTLLASIGRAGLNSIYPNDFEYYACALELTNSKDEIVDTLVFPVMPSSMNQQRNPINNVKKSVNGVISLINTSFTPFPINLSGNFGRKLRILTNSGIVPINAVRSRITNQEPLEGYEGRQFSLKVKTGYGLCKYLEKMCLMAYSLDTEGKPYRLFFYNLAFNSSYMVEAPSFSFSMEQSNNMIWNYSLSLKAIAPAYSVRANEKSSIINAVSSSIINQGLDMLMTDVQNIVSSRLNSRI